MKGFSTTSFLSKDTASVFLPSPCTLLFANQLRVKTAYRLLFSNKFFLHKPMNSQNKKMVNRRGFLKGSAVTAAGFMIVPRHVPARASWLPATS
jgi:TAT (twin-arginine translocation) pathway signal sequence